MTDGDDNKPADETNPKPLPRCPKCGAEMLLRWSRRGPFYGCSRYPECKGTALPPENQAEKSN
jgi:DNA topoisomerase-3